MKKVLIFTLTLLFLGNLAAQPVNDECMGLINLGIAPICPHPDTFNNVDATLSMVFSDPGMNIPGCFNGTGDRDVWFQFTTPADITDFNITITGVSGPNGSITQPQVAVYRGDCSLDNLSELFCVAAPMGSTDLTFDILGLDINENYFLRINDWSAIAAPNWGDFVICIKEPDPTFTMGTDTESSLCSGTLFDSGGPDNDYSNDEDFTFTICPDVPTGCINLEFVSFNIEANYEFLLFYDGPDINSPLITSFTGTNTFPIQAGNNCITIQFTSDFTVVREGFEILWNCSPFDCNTTQIPCQETIGINNLPFSLTGQSTCNSGDDLSTGPCTSNDPLLDGEDFVYTYQSNSEACLNIAISNADINTGLSVYSDCPVSPNAECLGSDQNVTGDSLSINNLQINAFQTIYIVISNGDGCTNFDIQINEIECLKFATARSSCEDALILNVCEDLPEYFAISQQPNLNPDYFQPGINDGCWPGVGASHYSWLFFQAQANGEFGVLIENTSSSEATNINIQVWGPIADHEAICSFMASSQPARSTGALNTNSSLTGLTNVNPLDASPVADICEGTNGDGFVSALPVQEGQFYLILINDFDGSIEDGGMALDFGPTTAGVLDGLPEDTPLNGQDYTLIGDASYYTDIFDFSCIQMTGDVTNQLSCVWAENQIDFSQPFSNTIAIYLGENDGGADGICMVYQQSIMGDDICGISGEGIGAEGIDNSFIIEFDTWQNANQGDPFEDHIAVNINGDMGAPISGPVTLANIENGQEHAVTFNWDPGTNTYEVIFDGVLLITGTFDIIQNCFQGSSMAYCGFTSSTGAATNLQYVCTGDNQYPTSKLDSIAIEICQGDSIFLGGAEQTVAGFYTDFFMAISGCDSTIVTELIVFPDYLEAAEMTICEGESIFLGGANQTEAGIYSDTLSSVNGCDSIVATTLNVLDNFNLDTEATICEGESIFLGGANQTEAGTYTDVLIAVNGCDSIIATTLNVLDKFNLETEATICEGESIFLEGAEQTVTGLYTDVFMASNGCDSTIITNLTVIENTAIIAPPSDIDCTPENYCTELNASNPSSGNEVSYSWSVSGSGQIESEETTLNPTVCGPGVYTLEVINTIDGLTCSNTDSVTLVLDESVRCYDFPNAFTPNGDQVSAIFELLIIGGNYEVVSLKIFNRWGKTVHEGSGTQHGWDGTYNGENASSEVYFFIFEILNTDSGEIVIESGDLTLIR